ncbi:unnamed protein product [Pleuronectes platessa]|uniref:Uncharacterized protein n=1 Tax=Pleuronectes platessa TaxID=8262 RepID=A0A9N7YF34_PLEPL|nr:unnamed protein product [Pleuronectes platessa]
MSANKHFQKVDVFIGTAGQYVSAGFDAKQSFIKIIKTQMRAINNYHFSHCASLALKDLHVQLSTTPAPPLTPLLCLVTQPELAGSGQAVFSLQRNKEATGEKRGRERMDTEREVEGEGAAGGPCEAGCDFNTWSSPSHYRPQSEEHRGQI